LFVADEFRENATDPFKATSDATKIIQYYWDMVAKRYLKESLTPLITLLTSVNKTISLEIDSRYSLLHLHSENINNINSKLSFSEVDDLARNKTNLVDHVNQLINKIVSKEMVEKIPIPIK
jgi:hypothetical protein